MIDSMLVRGMGSVRRARPIVELPRVAVWAAAALLALAVIALVIQGVGDENPDLLGFALGTLLVGGIQVLLLFGFAALVDPTAARLEVELWQSPLFEDDEDE